jgi:hypothetical protein
MLELAAVSTKDDVNVIIALRRCWQVWYNAWNYALCSDSMQECACYALVMSCSRVVLRQVYLLSQRLCYAEVQLLQLEAAYLCT